MMRRLWEKKDHATFGNDGVGSVFTVLIREPEASWLGIESWNDCDSQVSDEFDKNE
jgi:hypothetical protein